MYRFTPIPSSGFDIESATAPNPAEAVRKGIRAHNFRPDFAKNRPGGGYRLGWIGLASVEAGASVVYRGRTVRHVLIGGRVVGRVGEAE